MSGARAAKASRRRKPSISPKNASRPAAWALASAARKSRRNSRESTRTGSRKPGLQRTQRLPSSEIPPPGTIIWRCGWGVHCRAPAVHHGGGADARAEVVGIGGDREQRLGRRVEQQVVDD